MNLVALTADLAPHYLAVDTHQAHMLTVGLLEEDDIRLPHHAAMTTATGHLVVIITPTVIDIALLLALAVPLMTTLLVVLHEATQTIPTRDLVRMMTLMQLMAMRRVEGMIGRPAQGVDLEAHRGATMMIIEEGLTGTELLSCFLRSLFYDCVDWLLVL
jgi:hypothetical protein